MSTSLQAQTVSPLERRLGRVIVPKVEFKETSLDSTLDFMAQIPVKTHQMETAVNMVKAYKTANPELGDVKITLSLSNVPWTELLRYICLAANVQYRYEAFAVFIEAPKPPPKQQ
ncbi:MAG: hypothetical protein ABI443_03540 [Chthoniobacterales bacterium]